MIKILCFMLAGMMMLIPQQSGTEVHNGEKVYWNIEEQEVLALGTVSYSIDVMVAVDSNIANALDKYIAKHPWGYWEHDNTYGEEFNMRDGATGTFVRVKAYTLHVTLFPKNKAFDIGYVLNYYLKKAGI